MVGTRSGIDAWDIVKCKIIRLEILTLTQHAFRVLENPISAKSMILCARTCMYRQVVQSNFKLLDC